MPADVSAPLPEEVFAPGTTITVTFDDPATVIETLNVYGVSPVPFRGDEEDAQPFVPMFTYGPG